MMRAAPIAFPPKDRKDNTHFILHQLSLDNGFALVFDRSLPLVFAVFILCVRYYLLCSLLSTSIRYCFQLRLCLNVMLCQMGSFWIRWNGIQEKNSSWDQETNSRDEMAFKFRHELNFVMKLNFVIKILKNTHI